MLFTLISLLIILLLQVIMLFEFLNHTHQNLLRFFMIIFDSDFTMHFQEKVKSSPFIELNKAFNKVIDNYKDLSRDKELQKNQIVLERDVPDREVRVTVDPHLIEQVMINLISNSIDALTGTQTPLIWLSAKMVENHPVVEITDNGKGIHAEQMERIFVPFYTTKQEGTGIGLSFSRQIMKLHGGTIAVKSEPGVETVFTLKF